MQRERKGKWEEGGSDQNSEGQTAGNQERGLTGGSHSKQGPPPAPSVNKPWPSKGSGTEGALVKMRTDQVKPEA